MTKWVYPSGTAGAGPWETSIGASDSKLEVPGWHHTGIRTAEVDSGQALTIPAAKEERIVVPLRGGPLRVIAEGVSYALRGRAHPFAGPTDVIYVGINKEVQIVADSAVRVAVASAPATVSYPTVLMPAEDVKVELRGNGPTSREIHNFGMVGQLEADKFLVCEVLTPAGNWSSYPPHKHDEIKDGENHLEEIYYYEVRPACPGAGPTADVFGIQRVSGADAERPIEISDPVRSGDVVLIPYGWHGPAIASPTCDMYYLNVMAGPGERSWDVTVDDRHGWVPGALEDQALDPRLPLR